MSAQSGATEFSPTRKINLLLGAPERLRGEGERAFFRADFQPIAKEVLVVKSPGPALADPAEFRWTRLRKGLRMRPLGPEFQG